MSVLIRAILALHFLAFTSVSVLATSDQLDYLFVGGRVYDGSLSDEKQVAVGVKDALITYVGPVKPSVEAKRVIDILGLILAPGFIDPHTHAWNEKGAEGPLLHASYLTQGIATVISGNDGQGPADFQNARAALQARGVASNLAMFVGHGSIRRQVMGMENRAPTDTELAEMKQLVRAAMETGALGLSSGLFYAPGSFATTGEVIELTRVAGEYGGIYESHIRDESNYTIGLLASVKEAIDIGRQAGVPVHIAHIKALGVDVWGQSAEVIALIEAAHAEGLKVTADQYPWRASGTRISNALVPRWAMAGGREKMRERLGQMELAKPIAAEMAENLRRRGGPGSILLTGGKAAWKGKTLAEYAKERQTDPVKTAIHILHEGDAKIASFNMNEDDIEAFMRRPWVMTSSDGGRGHPRKFASFPRKYQRYVQEQQTLSLAEFIHRSTVLTAQTFGLEGRGEIKEGAFADLLVFHPEGYGPAATFEEPGKLSKGVQYLFVNGKPAIWQGELTRDATVGRVLLLHKAN